MATQVYETLFYLLAPFMLPISIIIRPNFWGYTLVATIVLYLLNVIIMNEVHLRLKKERVSWKVLLVYYVSDLLKPIIQLACSYTSNRPYTNYSLQLLML